MTIKPDGGPVHPSVDAERLKALYADLFSAMRENDGERAEAILRDILSALHQGMSLRDYFAGQYISGASALQFRENGSITLALVEAAYAFADAMLEARAK